MTDPRLAAYREGAITADHLAVECLARLEPGAPASALAGLPFEVLARVVEFVREDRPGRMVTNYGPLPTEDQVEAARRWLDEAYGSAGQLDEALTRWLDETRDPAERLDDALRRLEELGSGLNSGPTHDQVMDAARRALG